MNQLRHKYKIETSRQVSNSLLAVVSEVSDRNGTMYRSERRWYGHMTSCDILDKSRYEAERTSAGPLLKDHSSNWFSWSIYFWHSNLFNKNPIFGIGKIDHQLSDKWYIKTDFHDKNNHKISDFFVTQKFIKLTIAWQYQFCFKCRLCKYSGRWFYWCSIQVDIICVCTNSFDHKNKAGNTKSDSYDSYNMNHIQVSNPFVRRLP